MDKAGMRLGGSLHGRNHADASDWSRLSGSHGKELSIIRYFDSIRWILLEELLIVTMRLRFEKTTDGYVVCTEVPP